MEEYIIAPAVKKDDEIRISRFCHAELISYDNFFKGAEQGFITSLNRFVDRKEALKIAKQNNKNLNKLCESDELYSEDLFMNEHELINKYKELEKMVELMAKEYVCKGNKNKYCRIWETKEYGSCVECVIESFRKKAKKKASDENELWYNILQ